MVEIGKINKLKLEPLLIDLFSNPTYKENAQRTGNEMKQENFSEELCEFILSE